MKRVFSRLAAISISLFVSMNSTAALSAPGLEASSGLPDTVDVFGVQTLADRGTSELAQIGSPTPAAEWRADAGRIRRRELIAGTGILGVLGGLVWWLRIHSEKSHPTQTVSPASAVIPSNITWTPEVHPSEIPAFLARFNTVMDHFILENSRSDPRIPQYLRRFMKALDGPVVIRTSPSTPQPFAVHFRPALGGTWTVSLDLNMATIANALEKVSTGDPLSTQQFGNALVRTARLLDEPNPSALPDFLQSQAKKYPAAAESFEALTRTVETWGYSMMVWFSGSPGLAYTSPTFDRPDVMSLRIDFGIDAGLFKDHFEPFLAGSSRDAQQQQFRLALVLAKEGGGAQNILAHPQAALEYQQIIDQANLILEKITDQRALVAASLDPASLLLFEKITARQALTEVAGYHAALNLLASQHETASALHQEASSEPEGPVKILLNRLGGLMRDLEPYTGIAREFRLRRNIFFAETYSFLKVPVTAIIMDRSRRHLLTLQNGKPIDQPGALDFLVDPTRTGESGPIKGSLSPRTYPHFPAPPFTYRIAA